MRLELGEKPEALSPSSLYQQTTIYQITLRVRDLNQHAQCYLFDPCLISCVGAAHLHRRASVAWDTPKSARPLARIGAAQIFWKFRRPLHRCSHELIVANLSAVIHTRKLEWCCQTVLV
jgi:hypothetical protein